MKYIKQLDSVRAIAVLLVIISHWIPPYYLINKIPMGALGVDTFFVLSGFLITWILLSNRQKTELEDISKKSVIRNFYIRRTLRIFPIYYLVLILILIFHNYTDTDIKTSYPYFFTYTSNFYIFNHGKWEGVGIVSHLWSLAVEEQFYLIWPAIMLFVNRKYLLYVIWGFIAIGVISQFLFRIYPMGPVLTSACFQAFGVGALLAWHLVYFPEGLPRFYKLIKPFVLVAFVVFVLGLVKPEWGIYKMFRTFSCVFGLFIITYLVYKEKTGKLKFGFIWNNRYLIAMGKISYGIYLYHPIISYMTTTSLRKYFGISAAHMLPHKMGYGVMLGVNFVILMIVSWLSWRLIEKPILALKKHFEYTEKNAGRQYVQV